MSKILVLAEGNCEKAFIDTLLEKDLLFFSRKDLLYEDTFQERQINVKIENIINMLPPEEKVIIYRIGDKFSDELVINKRIKLRIEAVKKVLTKPEFEILFILDKNLFDRYSRNNSGKKCSAFYKEYDKSYKKQTKQVEDYFSGKKNEEIRNLLNEYDKKRKSTHNDEELSINDLLKKDI